MISSCHNCIGADRSAADTISPWWHRRRLRGCSRVLQPCDDEFGEVVGVADAVDAGQQAALFVVAEQRVVAGGKHAQAVADGLLGVVGACAGGQPLEQFLLLDLEADGGVQRRPELVEAAAERASLRRTAGEAIEHEAVAAVGLCKPLGDDVDDDVVWHEFPAVQVPFGHPAERGAPVHVAPEDVAGGDVRYAEAGREPDRLGSLAGPGRADQDDAQRPVGPSRAATLRLARPSQLRRGRRTRHLRTGCQAVPFGTYGRRGRSNNSSPGVCCAARLARAHGVPPPSIRSISRWCASSAAT